MDNQSIDEETYDLSKIKSFNAKEMPSSPFLIFLGKRRSGKSVLAEYLCHQLINESKVDCIFLFSKTDAGFDIIKDHEARFDTIDLLPNIVDNFKKYNEYNKIQPLKSKKIKLSCICIIDDFAIELKTKQFNILEYLSVNGRHCAYPPLNLTFMILAQSLTKIPRVVRLNCDVIFLNQISSMKELEMVTDENLFLLDSSRNGKKQGRDLYHKLVQSEDFQFIAVANYTQNSKTFEDYIFTYKAILDKNGKFK